mgnify:CR=1 FL=1
MLYELPSLFMSEGNFNFQISLDAYSPDSNPYSYHTQLLSPTYDQVKLHVAPRVQTSIKIKILASIRLIAVFLSTESR